MTEKSTRSDDTTTIERSVVQQDSRLDNQQDRNSARQTNINLQAVPMPMIPTPLEYFWCSAYRKEISVILLILLMILLTSASVIIVTLTPPKTEKGCKMKFDTANENLIKYNYGPRSVAVGYFDNNTRSDVVVANQFNDSISVFLGHGNGTFTKPIIYPTGLNSNPFMVAISDFNNDHYSDIAITYFGTNSIGIYLGSGNGSFTNHTVIPTKSSRPTWIHIADMNNDELADIVTTDYGNHSISILFGYGDANFPDRLTYPTGYDSFPSSVVSGDLNNDKWLDLVVANYGTNNIGILLASGNGTFFQQNVFSTGIDSHPYAVTIGHFDDDSFLDIAVANHGTNTVGVLLNYGDGTFTKQTVFQLESASPYFVIAGYFDNDRWSDLVVTNKGTNNIALLFGLGNGTFSSMEVYSTGSSSTIAVAAGHFNIDKRLDIIVVNNDTHNMGVLLGTDQGLENPKIYPGKLFSSARVVADVNMDGYLDIITVSPGRIYILFGSDNASFPYEITYAADNGASFIIVEDLDSDTYPDIVVTDRYAETISVRLGYGNGLFTSEITYSTGEYPVFIIAGQFNEDKYLDLVVVNEYESYLSIFFGYGNGSFQNQTKYHVENYSNQLAVGYLNKDPHLDLIVVYRQSNYMDILLGHGNGSFVKKISYLTGSSPNNIAVADLNIDGYLDIVVVNFADMTLRVFLGYGNGTFANPEVYSTGVAPVYMLIDDFDGDTYLDIIVSNLKSKSIGVFLGYGDGLFTSQIEHPVSFEPDLISSGDFNKDGLLDIVVYEFWEGHINILLHKNMGGFGDEISFASDDGSHLRHVVVNDFNRDHQLDIIVANYGTNNIGVLFGQANGQFQRQEMLSIGPNSHPLSFAIGDFNGDGLQDTAIVNSGTKSIATFLGNRQKNFARESDYEPILGYFPSIIVAGNINGDERSDIVIVFSNTNDIDIAISYDEGVLVPQEKYSTGQTPHDIASGDFNNDTYLDIAVVNRGSHSLGIYLGYNNGSFADPITYSTGLYSEPVSLAVGHLNKDLSLDIVVLNFNTGAVDVFLGLGNGSFIHQNLYSARNGLFHIGLGDLNNDGCLDIVAGRIYGDDLVILLGYGNGSFSGQTVASTGSDMQKLAVGDFNNDNSLDLVIFNRHPDAINIFLGSGNGSFDVYTTITTDRDPRDVVIEDLNRDNYQDIVIVAHTLGFQDYSLDIFLADGNGSFIYYSGYPLVSSPIAVVVGDINGDGHVDIVVTLFQTKNICVFLGSGDGTFISQVMHDSGFLPNHVTIGHFNKDGRLDIVITDSTSNHIHVLLGYPSFNFLHQTTLHTGNDSQLQAIVVDDFNNDHRMDIVVASSNTNHIHFFTGEGNNSFAKHTVYSTGHFPCSLAAGDFNNDTYLDIVVANRDNDTVGVFFGYGNGSFTDQVTHLTGIQSQPISVSVADFNNDSFVDIVVVNRGAHNVGIFLGNGMGNFSEIITYSTKFGSFPFSLAVGDFNNDRKLDFVVANEDSDGLKLFLQTC